MSTASTSHTYTQRSGVCVWKVIGEWMVFYTLEQEHDKLRRPIWCFKHTGHTHTNARRLNARRYSEKDALKTMQKLCSQDECEQVIKGLDNYWLGLEHQWKNKSFGHYLVICVQCVLNYVQWTHGFDVLVAVYMWIRPVCCTPSAYAP